MVALWILCEAAEPAITKGESVALLVAAFIVGLAMAWRWPGLACATRRTTDELD